MSKRRPATVNKTIEAQGLKKLDSINRLGIEITYPLHRYLDVSLRYTKRLATGFDAAFSTCSCCENRSDSFR